VRPRLHTHRTLPIPQVSVTRPHTQNTANTPRFHDRYGKSFTFSDTVRILTRRTLSQDDTIGRVESVSRRNWVWIRTKSTRVERPKKNDTKEDWARNEGTWDHKELQWATHPRPRLQNQPLRQQAIHLPSLTHKQHQIRRTAREAEEEGAEKEDHPRSRYPSMEQSWNCQVKFSEPGPRVSIRIWWMIPSRL